MKDFWVEYSYSCKTPIGITTRYAGKCYSVDTDEEAIECWKYELAQLLQNNYIRSNYTHEFVKVTSFKWSDYDHTMSTRLKNALCRAGFVDIEEIEKRGSIEALKEVRNLGSVSIMELLDILDKHGVNIPEVHPYEKRTFIQLTNLEKAYNMLGLIRRGSAKPGDSINAVIDLLREAQEEQQKTE